MRLKSYLVASSIVWVAIILATSVILRGTPYFAQFLPIIGGGAVWFVVITPTLFREQ